MKKLGTAIVVGAAALAAATSISAAPPARSTAMGQKDIVQTAVAAGQFKTLVALVKQAGLTGALSGPGQLTLFAPTDAAFAKVPKSTLAALGKNKAQLKAVLLYHVVPGRITSAQITDGSEQKTVEGSALAIAVNGGVTVNDATVIQADVEAENGVIHVIDRVLIPAA